MLRDFRFLRRNSGKNPSGESENVPADPKDYVALQTNMDASRPPLSTIQDPGLIPKPSSGQDVGFQSKVGRTPKSKGRNTDAAALPMRTPDKHGGALSIRSKFGWAQQNEPGLVGTHGSEWQDGERSELKDYLGQPSRVLGPGNGFYPSMTPKPTRTAGGRACLGYSDSNSTQSTPTKSVNKPPNPGTKSKLDGHSGARGANFATLYKGMSMTCSQPTAIDLCEAPDFDLRVDPSFWMEHNVQVFIRVRPLNSMEKKAVGYSRCLKQETADTITWIGQPETRFTFDHVACETVDQDVLFRAAGLPMVENCLSGYNSCIFAYGQTGSGKTYTMLGDIHELEVKLSPNRGMTPRIFEFLFTSIQAEEERRRVERLKYSCKCSFLEIYNEQITDLLNPSSTNLLLREDIKKGVYVENLSEFEVRTVSDILELLKQGSSNRRVAATNMNRESSRSHSVFTCVIESRWEKDSMSNLRFARLNLVDLAGSERQKTSGAEGERLKEAANINKSLSTLGHVIMVLVDVVHGKPRHVPYRDSRLTFLLQDSLGGNSKTMIIANVSPSISCAAETLNTLKFAQRAKLIQNNAVVNEDSSGDVTTLQHQIQLLKEELSALKRQPVSRSLSFGLTPDSQQIQEYGCREKSPEGQYGSQNLQGLESKSIIRMSSKQLKSLETTLAGALRREQMAETTIKQLEGEIEQLNKLVREREEDTRCTKMMLKFREAKIQRMDSLLGSLIPADAYLLQENTALFKEIEVLKAKVDSNPEVTRFAKENIRLSDQLRKLEDFYEKGERETLIAEVSELRNQMLQFLDGNSEQRRSEDNRFLEMHDTLQLELKHTLGKLEECRSNLNSCLEDNTKLRREIYDLRSSNNVKSPSYSGIDNDYVTKNSCLVASHSELPHLEEGQKGKGSDKYEILTNQTEDIINVQLELDILKIILQEERSYRFEVEEKTVSLHQNLNTTEEKVMLTKQCEDATYELKNAKSVIEALESEQILLISELEDLRKSNSHYVELLSKHGREFLSPKEMLRSQELGALKCSKDSPLLEKLKKMQDSLEMSKKLNVWYRKDRAFQTSNEEEMDEVRREAEAETAEVIVCLQEELAILQQEVQNSYQKEMEMNNYVMVMEVQLRELQNCLNLVTHDYEILGKKLEQKDVELVTLSEEWKLLTSEIEEVLADGQEILVDAYEQSDLISNSFPHDRSWISGQVSRMVRMIYDKELLIDELNRCLENANDKKIEMECMLRSLRGATVVFTEAHQQEISSLMEDLNKTAYSVEKLERKIKVGEENLKKASSCAIAAFVIVNRLSEMNHSHLIELEHKDIQLTESRVRNQKTDILFQSQVAIIENTERQIQSLQKELKASQETCGHLRLELSEEKKLVSSLECKLADLEEITVLRTRQKIAELQAGVSNLRSCMDIQMNPEVDRATLSLESHVVGDNKINKVDCSETNKHVLSSLFDHKYLNCEESNKSKQEQDVTIILLKNEIESALENLKDVQAEMTKLRDEKEQILLSNGCSQGVMKCLTAQVLSLEGAMTYFAEQFDMKVAALTHKVQMVEKIAQEAGRKWCQVKQLFEFEVGDAMALAEQKTVEVYCILAKLEEAQDTMKETDIIINELMLENGRLKFEIEEMKHENHFLTNEIKDSQAISNLKHQDVEEQLNSYLMDVRGSVLELEGIVMQGKSCFREDFNSIAHEHDCLKSQFLESMKLMRSWLENVWAEIIVKDCAVSVLHLCHMGILLETITGLNAENGLLHSGLSESNSVIVGLKEHNLKSRKELEMCSVLKGRLLADIKSSFDCLSRKEKETGEFSIKLSSFEKKILDLQLQEELMLQRSNNIGSELVALIKDLDMSNTNVSEFLLDHEKLLRDKETTESCNEFLMMELSSKDLESVILASELEETALQKVGIEKENFHNFIFVENLKKELTLCHFDKEIEGSLLRNEVEEAQWDKQNLLLKVEEMALQKIDMEKENIQSCIFLENLKKKLTLCYFDKEMEVSLVRKEVEEAQWDRHNLLLKLKQCSSHITEVDEVNKDLKQEIQILKNVASTNDSLRNELGKAVETNVGLQLEVQTLVAEHRNLLKEVKMKDMDLELSFSHVTELDVQNQKFQNDISLLKTSVVSLQDQLDMRDAEIEKMNFMQNEISKLMAEKHIANQDLENKNSDYETSLGHLSFFTDENQRLQDKIHSLEASIASLQNDTNLKDAELNKLRHYQSFTVEEICSKNQDLLALANKMATLKEENASLRREHNSHKESMHEALTMSSSNVLTCFNLVETVDMISSKILNKVNQETITVADNMFQDICGALEMSFACINELESLEQLANNLSSENLSLHTELLKKDDIVKGLLFDLSLLQESASNAKDQKDEIKEFKASLEALEDAFAEQSGELEEAVARGRTLECQLQDKADIIYALESEVLKHSESVKLLSAENLDLKTHVEDISAAKNYVVAELTDQRKEAESLEMEVIKLSDDVGEMSSLLVSLRSDLNELTSERDHLQTEVLVLKEKLEMTEAQAEENEAVAAEAQQIAETRKVYAEEKEEEVKLLERSVEELECTINVLENKVDIVKGEAERQRLQREELEMELHALRKQMQNVRIGDSDMKRYLHEKEESLQEALKRIQILEREIDKRDTEIDKLKGHVSELILHAEAQAHEFKQKFKTLEAAMVEQAKSEGPSTHGSNFSSNKSEKNAVKSRGSGSPFKCMGLGIAQQLKSENDEEITAGRLRIEELENLAASRQKEIFMLNARLAAAESMTHDVIRDLLGVKLDMTNYVSLLDSQQVEKITEKIRLHSAEVKEEEVVIKLKQQLSEFIEERRGWLEEIERKQAEVVAANIALEKLRQQDQLVKAENEMLKMENINHKKVVVELEGEIKKLSGQQNLQQRIHHHAKIKEENNLLRIQNQDLSAKLRRTEVILSRVKGELACHRASIGKSPYIDLDEEQRLNKKLKETEEERLQLAHKLFGLCASILKAAGITKPSSEISLHAAEEAVEQLTNHVSSLEREAQDLKYKIKIASERARLSELNPPRTRTISPASSGTDDKCQTPRKYSQVPFLSTLDR